MLNFLFANNTRIFREKPHLHPTSKAVVKLNYSLIHIYLHVIDKNTSLLETPLITLQLKINVYTKEISKPGQGELLLLSKQRQWFIFFYLKI